MVIGFSLDQTTLLSIMQITAELYFHSDNPANVKQKTSGELFFFLLSKKCLHYS